MFGRASQGGEQADQLYFGMLGNLIAFLWSACRIFTGNDIIISTQIVNEMCVNLIKKAKFSEKKIQGLIISLYEQYTVLELSKEIQLKASGIRNECRFSYWDSIVVASALDCEADYLISEDMQDGFELEGKLKIINPYIA